MPYQYFPPTETNIEIDLRTELDQFLNGNILLPNMIPHGQWVILRKLKRDTDGNPIKGSEVDPVTGEPDMVFKSDNVTNEGYLFDDHLTRGRVIELRMSALTETFTAPKTVQQDMRFAVLTHCTKPERHDHILTISVDDDGNIVTPVKYLQRYSITNVLPAISDGSRVEFYRCIIEHQR